MQNARGLRKRVASGELRREGIPPSRRTSPGRRDTGTSALTAKRGLVRSALALLLLTGCAHAPTAGQASQDVEAAAVAATEPRARLRLVFDWSLQDRDAKFNGAGAIRMEPPYHARLDLFGPRGEGYMSAALVDFDLRMPPNAPREVLPPAAMLWSVFGVFRPPQGAQLTATRGDSTKRELEYRSGDQKWVFTLASNRVTRAEWTGPSQGRQTVEIREYGSRGLPSKVVYRDWRAFRELSVTLTETHDVAEPFPPDTWTPGSR